MENEISEQVDVESISTEPVIDLEYPKVCTVCKEHNLIQSIQDYLHTCAKCGTLICIHFASGVDPQFCKDCCKDITMTEENCSVTREHYNPETDVVTKRVHKYRSIKFEGLDWLFYQRKISILSDEELSMQIEYHQALYQGLINEREKRRIDYFRRNAGRHVTIRDSQGNDLNTISTTTTVKKTKTVKPRDKSSKEINIMAGLQTLLAQGYTPEQILQLVTGKK